MKSRKKNRSAPLILSHLGPIERALLEGDKRPAFLQFLNDVTSARRGIYALYDQGGKLYYIGLASKLQSRLDGHLKDRHARNWNTMTLFLVGDGANLDHLEGLVIAAANPPGNDRGRRIGTDMRKQLSSFLKKDASAQIDQSVYPGREVATDELSRRMTQKKLSSIKGTALAKILGITSGRVSQLRKAKELKTWIVQAGKRDRVLLHLQRTSKP